MKAYEKPSIKIEYLKLSKHIAACNDGTQINTMTRDICTAEVQDVSSPYRGMILFNSSNSECMVYEDMIETYCYTNGSSQMNLLGS